MTVIKAYTKLPAVSAQTLDSGGAASISVDDEEVNISLAFFNRADLHRFANAVMRAAANIEDGGEDPRHSMADGPVAPADGWSVEE